MWNVFITNYFWNIIHIIPKANNINKLVHVERVYYQLFL